MKQMSSNRCKGDHAPRRLTNTDPALRHGWHPVALAAEIGDEPVAVLLLGEPWVIARLDDGFVAFADHCPHRLALQADGQADRHQLVCAYHSWRFVVSGTCTAVPDCAPSASSPRRSRAAAPWGITERHGIVWIAPEEPFADIINLPEDDDPAFDSAWLPVTRTSTCAGLLAEMFLDTSAVFGLNCRATGHTSATGYPSGTMGQHPSAGAHPDVAGEDTTVPFPYQVETDGDGFQVRVVQKVADPAGPRGTGLRKPVRRRSDYAFRLPFMLRLRLEYPDAGTANTALICLHPESAAITRVYARILRNDVGGDTERLAEAVRSEQAMLDKDVALRELSSADGLSLSSADGQVPDDTGIRVGAAGVALRRVLAAFTDRAERSTTWDSPRQVPPRPRYARRPSVTAGRYAW
jgi:vanillate O-demethylase monooxygenase subunit